MYGDGLVPGSLGGLVGSGLGGLLERFQQNGRGDTFKSWVGGDENQAISPEDLRGALGEDTVDAVVKPAFEPVTTTWIAAPRSAATSV